jgi:hypothetical protein
MARINLSFIAQSVNGSIGKVTIQRHYYGNTVRSKPFPGLDVTNDQVFCRKNLSIVQEAWQSMSAQQRKAWDNFNTYSPTYCKNNANVMLKGYHLFLKHNLTLLTVGEPIITNITYGANDFQDTTGSFYWASDEFGFALDTGYDETNWIPLCKCTPPIKPTIQYFQNKLKVLQPDLSYPEDWVFYDVYLARYGVLPVPPFTAWFTFQHVNKFMPVMQAPFSYMVQ